MAAWIRSRILNADPDPGGLKRPIKKGKKTHPKCRSLGIKKDKKQYNW
jgi:hypothetical protein